MLKFITPETEDDLNQYWQQLEYLWQFMPYEIEDFNEFILNYLGELTVVYLGSLLVGCFVLEISNKTAELHGVYSPRFEERVTAPQRRVVKAAIIDQILDTTFNKLRKRALILKIQKENKAGRMFATRYGFRPLMDKELYTLDQGRIVYKLTKDDYGQQEKQTQSKKGN